LLRLLFFAYVWADVSRIVLTKQDMELIGIYTVDNNPDVHLVEVMSDDPPDKVDVGQITQEINGQPQGNWQTPWDEKYLDDKGETIIGDYFDIPKGGDKTRLVFFFHDIDFSKPLLTQEGQLALTKPTLLPDRLKDKLIYESPD
jgi:hypothetical protein